MPEHKCDVERRCANVNNAIFNYSVAVNAEHVDFYVTNAESSENISEKRSDLFYINMHSAHRSISHETKRNRNITIPPRSNGPGYVCAEIYGAHSCRAKRGAIYRNLFDLAFFVTVSSHILKPFLAQTQKAWIGPRHQ